MKKRNLLVGLLAVLSLTSCDSFSSEFDIGVRTDGIENSAVRLNIKYKETWVNNEVVMRAKFGHQENAVLHSQYYLSISETDPLYSPSNYTLTTIFSFTKEQLEPNTVTEKGWKFKYSSKEYNEIKISNLENIFKKTDSETTFYLIFHSSETNFSNITQFTSSKFKYKFNGTKLSIEHD